MKSSSVFRDNQSETKNSVLVTFQSNLLPFQSNSHTQTTIVIHTSYYSVWYDDNIKRKYDCECIRMCVQEYSSICERVY